MKKIKNVEEAFAAEGLDSNAIEITGVPERHVEALKAIAKLFVIHDAVNPDFQPDFTNVDQSKCTPYFRGGSPSGVGFSSDGYGHWYTISHVGSRLVSESLKASEHVANLFEDDYKNLMVYERKNK